MQRTGVASGVKEPEVEAGKFFDMFKVGEAREVLDLCQEERSKTLAHTAETGEPLKLRESLSPHDQFAEKTCQVIVGRFD